MRCWCATFEQRGQRSLNGAIQLVREMGLQNRELAAHREKHFKSEVMARLGEWEHRIEKLLQGFHSHVCVFSFLSLVLNLIHPPSLFFSTSSSSSSCAQYCV